ncbi:hypothetical protein K3495_g14234, partial [Podosphaera aphanis]
MAQHIRRLNPVKRGATPGALVTAVNSCVIPVATFGAEVWWPGTSRPSRHGNVTPPTSFLKNKERVSRNTVIKDQPSASHTMSNPPLLRPSSLKLTVLASSREQVC